MFPVSALTPSTALGTGTNQNQRDIKFNIGKESSWRPIFGQIHSSATNAPTGKHVEVPLVAIVRFREGKLAHEHIYWDQASVLVQLGLLNPTSLPVAGIETARKALNPTLASNTLFGRQGRQGP